MIVSFPKNYEVIECANCFGDIIVSATTADRLRKSGDEFMCVKGHANHFTKPKKK